jgi:hypothetical protein
MRLLEKGGTPVYINHYFLSNSTSLRILFLESSKLTTEYPLSNQNPRYSELLVGVVSKHEERKHDKIQGTKGLLPGFMGTP